MDNLLKTAVAIMLEDEEASLPLLFKFLTNEDYRLKQIKKIKSNKNLKETWLESLENDSLQMIAAPILNKLQQFRTTNALYNMFEYRKD